MSQDARSRPPLGFSTLAAVVLLGAEYFALSLGFDVQPLSLRDDGWSIAGHLGVVASFASVAVFGIFLVGLLADRSRLAALRVSRPIDARTRALLVLHFALYAGLWYLTTRIFDPEGPPAGSPALWLPAWLLLALGAAATAVLAALPAGQGRALAGSAGPLLAGGLVVGAGAWLAARGSRLMWEPLGPWTLAGAEGLLRFASDEVVADRESALLGMGDFQVLIDPECAGFEGAGLMAAFVTATLVLGRRELRFPHALLLLPLGLAAAFASNVLRIAALVLVGRHVSEEIAISGFHTKAGWILFCMLALAIVALSRRTRFFAKQPIALGFAHPTAAFLLPFLTLLALSFATGLVTRQIDYLYGVRILGAALVLLAFRSHYRGAGFDRPAGALAPARARALAAGLGLAAFAVFVALLPRPAAEDAAAWMEEWQAMSPAARAAWIALRVAGSVIVIPIAEELAFRGYLLRRLVARDFETVPAAQPGWLAIIVSSLAFGAVHTGWAGGALAGLAFALAQRWGGSIRDAIVAHVVANAAVALAVVGFGQWWIWM